MPALTFQNGHSARLPSDTVKNSLAFNGRFAAAPTSVLLVIEEGTGGGGNIAWYCTSAFGAVGEAGDVNTGSIGSDAAPSTVAVGTGKVLVTIELVTAFTNAAAADYFTIDWIRDGNDAADTAGNNHGVLGLLIVY